MCAHGAQGAAAFRGAAQSEPNMFGGIRIGGQPDGPSLCAPACEPLTPTPTSARIPVFPSTAALAAEMRPASLTLALSLSQLIFASERVPTRPHALSIGDPEQCTCAVRQLFPLGGPFTGNTAVTITGRAFQDLSLIHI